MNLNEASWKVASACIGVLCILIVYIYTTDGNRLDRLEARVEELAGIMTAAAFNAQIAAAEARATAAEARLAAAAAAEAARAR